MAAQTMAAQTMATQTKSAAARQTVAAGPTRATVPAWAAPHSRFPPETGRTNASVLRETALANFARALQGATGKYVGHQLAFLDDHRSPYQQIMNPYAGLHGLGERGAVGDGLRIEDHDVGVGAFLQSSLLARGRS